MSAIRKLLRRGRLIVAAAFLVATVALATPAQADGFDAVGNWLGNVLFGWVDCFKGMDDELGKARSRGYVGVLVTAPLSCGVNTAVRYTGVVVDVVAIPVTGKNAINPATLQSRNPPVQFPE